MSSNLCVGEDRIIMLGGQRLSLKMHPGRSTPLLACLQEMRLLAEMDNPTSAVDVYVNHLTTLLARKATNLASFQVGFFGQQCMFTRGT